MADKNLARFADLFAVVPAPAAAAQGEREARGLYAVAPVPLTRADGVAPRLAPIGRADG
jgi:hypothetical protein